MADLDPQSSRHQRMGEKLLQSTGGPRIAAIGMAVVALFLLWGWVESLDRPAPAGVTAETPTER